MAKKNTFMDKKNIFYGQKNTNLSISTAPFATYTYELCGICDATVSYKIHIRINFSLR